MSLAACGGRNRNPENAIFSKLEPGFPLHGGAKLNWLSRVKMDSVAGRCEACPFLPKSEYCVACENGWYGRPCTKQSSGFFRKCSTKLRQRLLLEKQEEEEEEEAAAAPSGRRARRSCRGSADAAIKEQTVDDAHPAGFHESAHDKASERQPTTDQARMRCSSDSWPRVRRLAAQRAMGGRG